MRAANALGQRVVNVLCVGLYLYVFIFGYKNLIYPSYEYYGMGWNEVDALTMATIWFMNLSLAFAMPPRYSRPSQMFLAVQFLIVFLPASIVCLNATLPKLPTEVVFPMLGAMYVGLCIQTGATYISGTLRRSILRGSTKPNKFIFVFFTISATVLISAVYTLRDIFQFSSFDALYSQRELLDDVSLGAFFRYGLAWQSMIFLPAIFTAGFLMSGRARWFALLGGTAGYMVLLGLTATKTTLLAPLIIASIYLLLKDRRQPFIALFALGLSALICVPFVMDWLDTAEIIQFWYIGIVNFRILSVPQLLYSQYLDFFSIHPLTYASHVKVLGVFLNYPYAEEISLIIGEYYYPGSSMNANAGMWAQDGLAGFGLVGIVMVSCILSFVMIVLDIAARPHNARWIGASLAMLTLFISNASLFTTMLTGGLGLVIVILFSCKPIAWPAMNLRRTPHQ